MKSIWIIYLVIIIYYLLGTVGIYFINRKKDPETRRKAWIKHVTYFFLTSLVFFSIAIKVSLFRYVAVLIIIAGFLELGKLFLESGYLHKIFFVVSILLLALLSTGFLFFSAMDQGLVLFAFLILCIFDGFSQVMGQLFGKRKLFPKISPNKTVEGFIGGASFAILSGLVFRQLIPDIPLPDVLLMGTVVMLFAFAGDSAKSVYKRKYNVKDFSRLIPGHGGFLDRFDSLIAGGAGVALMRWLTSL
jgi:phosphatidate cytidylyltransferase